MIFHTIANTQGKERQRQEKEYGAQYLRLGQRSHEHHQRKHTPCAEIPTNKCGSGFAFEKYREQRPRPPKRAIVDKSGKAEGIVFYIQTYRR